jgi:ATP-dependent Clp protease ATP-binding subunit ClpA
MDLDKKNWTYSALESWTAVNSIAQSKNHKITNIYHLLISLWDHSNTPFIEFIENKGLSIKTKTIHTIVDKFAKKNPDMFFSIQMESLIEEEIESCVTNANLLAIKHDNLFIGTEHFIWGILQSSDKFCDFLLENGIDTEHFKNCIEAFLKSDSLELDEGDSDFDDIDFDDFDKEDAKESQKLNESQINRFCSLLNDTVIKPEFGIISGRDKEISNLEEILSCKIKSNCILLGEAGTGKTSVVEGLAQNISSPKYCGPLKNKKIYSLDVGSLIAGSKYRGQFEMRFNKLIEELKDDSNAILFIDEIHSIIGAGSGKEGSLDFANLIKPALARGEIKCIGATTHLEYKKYFEKDPALTRRFHPLDIEEPNVEQMKNIVLKAVPAYEKYHKLKFPKKLLKMSVDMCETYLPHKKFIDKAFDVIDRSFAKAKIRVFNAANQLDEEPISVVTLEDLLKVISELSKINVEILRNNLDKKFSDLATNFKKEIFGQNKAIDKIYNCLACAKAGLNAPNKPLSSFLFVGPTSVGKTYTAKKISKEFFGNDSSYLQLNMSEYQESASVSRLLGASAGYVGHNEGGILTEFVRNNPNSLVLFDEIEKGDPAILNLLLQILDEGKLRDGCGRDIDFSRTIIVLTSNIGSVEAYKTSMGFLSHTEDATPSFESSISKSLSPEMRSRIDEVIIFEKINTEAISKIFDQCLDELKERADKKGIKINCQINISDLVDDVSKLHAREIKNIFRNKVQTAVAHFIASGKKNRNLTIKVLDKKVVLS